MRQPPPMTCERVMSCHVVVAWGKQDTTSDWSIIVGAEQQKSTKEENSA
jgi:hypothetical protein